MRITNKHTTSLGLPTGQILPVDQPTEVADWDSVKKNSVVRAWVDAKILIEEELKPSKGKG